MIDNDVAVRQEARLLAMIRRLFPMLMPMATLLLCYLFLRLFFQQVAMAKIGFIYSSGVLVNWFYGLGHYVNGEWFFGIGSTQFILGASCSGTTFFSLLVAYLAYRRLTHQTSTLWLLMAFPIAILANAMRVLSSIFAHLCLAKLDQLTFTSEVHTATGSITFFMCFIAVAYFVEKNQVSSYHGS